MVMEITTMVLTAQTQETGKNSVEDDETEERAFNDDRIDFDDPNLDDEF